MIGWNTDTEGGVTKEELNRKISEAREPVKKWEHAEFSPDGAWKLFQRFTGHTFEFEWRPRDWTGSEDASAVLLDELIKQYGPKTALHAVAHRMIYNRQLDRKTAIALAWLRWKGIE